MERRHLRLTYTLGTREQAASALDHPVIEGDAANYPRMGMNVATVAVQMLAEFLPPHRDRYIPHPRVAALVATARGLPEHLTSDEDRRFLLPALDGPAQVVSLDQLPLPAGTPPIRLG